MLDVELNKRERKLEKETLGGLGFIPFMPRPMKFDIW